MMGKKSKKFKGKKKKKLISRIIDFCRKNKWVDIFIILIGTLFYFILLFDNDMFYTAHDLVFHISNIKSMASDISINNLLPDKILSELVNNYGYGVNLFYPVFPHLVGAYLYFIFKDIIITFKVLDFLIIGLSGIFMYKYIYKLFKDRRCALIGGVTYISMPYLFADVFIRCALNESFLFFIVPLIFLGIHYLIDDNNKFMFYLLFVLGYVMAINSHLVLSVYLTIAVIIYLLVLMKEKIFNIDIIKSFIFASLFIILLSLSFIVPLLEHHNLGIYEIFNIKYIGLNSVQSTELYKYILPIRHLDIPIYLPLIVSISMVYLVFKWNKIVREDKNILCGMIAIIIFALVIATNDYIWYFIPNLLKSIQFGWRMSLVIVFGFTVLFCYLFKLSKSKINTFLIINFVLVFFFGNFFNSFIIVRTERDSESYLKEVFNGPRWEKEYLPIQTISGFLNVKQGDNSIIVIDGKAKVKIIDNNVPDMVFKVDCDNKKVFIKLPRIYYYGYEVIDEKGKEYSVQMTNDGLVGVKINKDGKYKLNYVGTMVEKIAYLVNCVSIILFGWFLFKLKKDGVKNGNK